MDDIRVLIVEDDPMVADINKSFTENIDGFRVVGTARNGREALDMCRDRRPDLVVLDIFMPGIDGMGVLASLRQTETAVDIIMITAASDGATISKAMRYGIAGYIIKPFKFERYRSVLESFRDFQRKARGADSLDQADIDKVFAARPDYDSRDMPKNFHVQTLNLIVDFLCASLEARSAEEVAAGIGISRVTARRYLEYLVTQGRLQMLLDYAAVGRPVHRFRLVEAKG
ncbi:MAG: response regulator [Negativicutes bacterium]|nr:response regulator [Negativicutes bacterium]